jgi:two-component system chemotaxis sensor kinase CheA
MTSVAAVCQAVESHVANGESTVTPSHREAIVTAWTSISRKMERLLLKETDDFMVRVADYHGLVEAVRSRRDHQALDAMLQGWRKEPVAERFARLGAGAKAIAARLGRGDLQIKIEADDVRAAPEQLSPVWSSFVHLIRNAVDHGLETPDERRRVGKPEQGTLTFRAKARPDSVTIEVADDGRGIDWDAIARKASASGLPATTPTDLKNALFAGTLSTRDAAGDMSGLGIGLSAVRASILAVGGSLDVTAVKGHGTCFAVELPASYFHGKSQTAPIPSAGDAAPSRQ